MRTLDLILTESAKRHKHLCPRQVLGARMGLYAAELLGLELPRDDKCLLVIAETDGCAVDGLSAATGCHIGSRTLRIMDLGKVAATFVHIQAGEVIRLAPKHEIRSRAVDYVSHARNRWEAMLLGYQKIPAEELFNIQPVCLNAPLAEIISRPNKRVECEICGEEVFNGREICLDNLVLCRSCAGENYYRPKTTVKSIRDEVLQIV